MISAEGSLLDKYVLFVFLLPSISEKNAKNQWTVFPDNLSGSWNTYNITVIVNFRSSGCLYIHVLCLKMCVYVSALYLYPVYLSIGPVNWARKKNQRSGRSKWPVSGPILLLRRPLPAVRIAPHTCIIPQNVCTYLSFISLCSKIFYRLPGKSTERKSNVQLVEIAVERRFWLHFQLISAQRRKF